MKKVISIISIIVTFLLIYFLQINFFSWFNIDGVRPNLFVILLLFISLYINKPAGIIFGIIFGTFLDVLTSNKIGTTAIMYVLIAILVSYFNKNFSKDNKITFILMVVGCTTFFEVSSYILICVRNIIPLEVLRFSRMLVIELIFNILITIIIYPTIKNTGILLERIFKKNKGVKGFIDL